MQVSIRHLDTGYAENVAGSDKGHDKYGGSSSDSEDEALEQMRSSSSRRPSTNYRPEFAAKTLAQVRSTLGDASGTLLIAPTPVLSLSIVSLL